MRVLHTTSLFICCVIVYLKLILMFCCRYGSVSLNLLTDDRFVTSIPERKIGIEHKKNHLFPIYYREIVLEKASFVSRESIIRSKCQYHFSRMLVPFDLNGTGIRLKWYWHWIENRF